MLSTINIKILYTQPLFNSSIRSLHIFNSKHSPIIHLYQKLSIQQYIHSNATDQSSNIKLSASNNWDKRSQQSTSISSNKSNQKTILPSLHCRLIQPDEFTNEFENYVFRTCLVEAPMRKHLQLTEPDECTMLFLRQILQRAKEDRVSLGFYYDSNNDNNQNSDETKKINSVKQDDMQQSSYSSSINQQNFPICYIINHIETMDDPPEKNDFNMNINNAPMENQDKYKYIIDILSKIMENIDLFAEYKAHRIMQNVLGGIQPEYANQGLFTRLEMTTIDLARVNKCDLIYAKVTSDFSTRAVLKLGFDKVRTIDYNTYQNDRGQYVFTGMSKIHQTCSLLVKDLRL